MSAVVTVEVMPAIAADGMHVVLSRVEAEPGRTKRPMIVANIAALISGSTGGLLGK